MATLRYSLLIVAAVLTVHARDVLDLLGVARGVGGRDSDESRVILVVADGLRWQEVFRGADSVLLFGNPHALNGNGAAVRRKYWRSSVAERRSALLPFLWGRVAREGQLYGNRDAGSEARVTNPMKFSYPGYNELLVGYPDPRIDRNDFGPNPNVTVFEWLHRRREFQGRVAVFGTWSLFHDIFNTGRSRLHVGTTDRDALTHGAAMQFLRSEKPRALFVGYGETDDWAHKERYDLTLDAAHAIDRYLAELWDATQSMPQYRGRTTLIVVADHGRGRSPDTWMHHGSDIDGSAETWLAIIGPSPSASVGGVQERTRAITLSQTAATVAAALGLDYHADVRRAALPLALTVPR